MDMKRKSGRWRTLYEKGDEICCNGRRPVVVERYTKAVRINHWIAAACMIALAVTGLSLYWPPFFFITSLLGGGQVVRAVHPWIGVLMLVSFSGLFLRMWRLNIWENSDLKWALQIKDVLAGNEQNLPAIGKYNFGQKCIFWMMTLGLVTLIISGVMIWQRYFAGYFSIEAQRYALIIHSLVAVGLICVWIFHVYAAYWIRGSLDAMLKGKVTGGFAWRHHRRWFYAVLKARKLRR